MEYLNKDQTLFIRDEKGELIPQEIVLDLLPDKPKIKAIPMLKGELQKLFLETKGGETTKDQDNDIILKNCFEPKYGEKEVKFLKPEFSNAIVTGILALSIEKSQKEIVETGKKKALEDADFLSQKG